MKKIIIKGRVQGVFFRSNTKSMAKKLGIVGYVKNLEDGSVQIVAKGKDEKIKELVEWCKKGSLLARVDSISVKEIEDQSFSEFEIRY